MKSRCRAVELAQCLRVLFALIEDLSSNPRAHMVAHNYNSSTRGSEDLFWPQTST